MLANGISSERWSLAIATASSGTDCQVCSTSADAFSGRSTKAPGVTTLPVNSVVVAPATTGTLECVCGRKGSIRTTRTSVVAPSPQTQHQTVSFNAWRVAVRYVEDMEKATLAEFDKEEAEWQETAERQVSNLCEIEDPPPHAGGTSRHTALCWRWSASGLQGRPRSRSRRR